MKAYVINLPKDKKRRAFQEAQLQTLGISYEIVPAVSMTDIDQATYRKHSHDWQRPLREVEVACYYSHRNLWKKIAKEKEPVLILEDDALLAKNLPQLLNYFSTLKDIDYINLEVVGRKKLVAKQGLNIPSSNSKLYRLYLDRNGTGGYILYPWGAKKLLQLEEQIGIGLADAHINACYNLKAYQVEPAALIQMDQCAQYGFIPPFEMPSNIGTITKPIIQKKQRLFFGKKRAFAQLRQGWQQIKYFFKATRREITINKEDFNF
jgi:glycosyl transferase family 25